MTIYQFARLFLSRAASVAALLVAAPMLFAQIDSGSIVGRVTDPSGAAIAGAAITVTNAATGVTVSTKTNEGGQYQLTALPPGNYSVKATAAGFTSQVRNNIELDVQSRPSIDFGLSVGQVSEVVEIKATSPLLQTQSADVGAVVQSQQIVDLPLNGRRYSDLALLEAGIQKLPDANVANSAPDRFNSNGNLETQNYFSLDGVSNNSGSTNLQEGSVQIVQPPPDALQEFRLQTRTYSAEFGTSAGAVVNATIKSGTNQIHGNLFEFVRNNDFDANTFFNNANGVPIGHFSQNQFGGTIGGPIIKNKTFFFADYQRFTSRQATTLDSVVPTPLMKQGNFSEFGSALLPSRVAGQSSCLTGNIIQASSLDPTALKLIALFPDPNIPSAVAAQGQPGSWTGGNNYQFQTSVPNDTYSWDTRIDHTINQKNQLFARYSNYHVDRQDPPWTSNPVAGNGDFATQYRIRGNAAALGLTTTLAPNLLNELRGGFSRDYAHSDPIGLEAGKSLAEQYGLTGVPQGASAEGIPPININGLVRLGSSPWRPQYQISQVWQLLDSLSWLKGGHSIKVGYDYTHTSDNFQDIRSPQGEISVNGIYTAGGSFGLPDFLLGDVDAVRFTTPLVVHNYMVGHSFYAQDTWRVSPKLTVNYGARYEIFSPVLNHQNEVSNFTAANGGGLVTAPLNASGWYARSLIHPDYLNVAPRFGLAYKVTDKLVLRGGYGIFYQHANRIGSESILQLNPPYLTDKDITQFLGSTTPVVFLKNGFPSADFAGGSTDLSKIQLRAQDPNQRTGYVEQASFGPQFEISHNTVLDLNYVGNWAHKMNRLRNANQGIVTGLNADGSPNVTFPYANLNNNATGNHAFLELATNDGNSAYNAFQASLTRRFDAGLSFGVNYTWSHNIADFADNLTNTPLPQNAYDYRAERSNSVFDVRHRFVANALWEIPVGKGKRYLTNAGTATDLVLGGWQLNSIVSLQTGNTFSVYASDQSGTGSQFSRPNCISDPLAGTTTDPSKYVNGSGFLINPAAFAVPAAGTFGSCAPYAFYGPGIQNVDLSLFKSFRILERSRVEFRSEFFNAFNHANFNNPNNYYSPQSLGSLGRVNSTRTDPREIQFALKLYF